MLHSVQNIITIVIIHNPLAMRLKNGFRLSNTTNPTRTNMILKLTLTTNREFP